MSERDELIDLIAGRGGDGYAIVHVGDLTDALLAAGWRKPRTITSMEELDPTPLGLVLRDNRGNIWVQRTKNAWGIFEPITTSMSLNLELPATVLWEPEPKQ